MQTTNEKIEVGLKEFPERSKNIRKIMARISRKAETMLSGKYKPAVTKQMEELETKLIKHNFYTELLLNIMLASSVENGRTNKQEKAENSLKIEEIKHTIQDLVESANNIRATWPTMKTATRVSLRTLADNIEKLETTGSKLIKKISTPTQRSQLDLEDKIESETCPGKRKRDQNSEQRLEILFNHINITKQEEIKPKPKRQKPTVSQVDLRTKLNHTHSHSKNPATNRNLKKAEPKNETTHKTKLENKKSHEKPEEPDMAKKKKPIPRQNLNKTKTENYENNQDLPEPNPNYEILPPETAEKLSYPPKQKYNEETSGRIRIPEKGHQRHS